MHGCNAIMYLLMVELLNRGVYEAVVSTEGHYRET